MSRYQKLLQSILVGTKDKSLSFADLCLVLEKLGFECRVRGDHFIYTRADVEELINIQPLNGKAKPYQVKQLREIILKYHMGGELNE